MPITLDQFAQGQFEAAVGNRILEYLRANSTMAFMEQEIMGKLFPDADPASLLSNLLFISAISPLHIHGLVEKRLIHTESGPRAYYRAA